MSGRGKGKAAAWGALVLGLGLLTAGDALAHGGLHPGESLWLAWRLTPDITLGTLLVAGLYIAGLRRRRSRGGSRTGGARGERTRTLRHLSFFAGLAAIFLALQSPIDPIAERVFFVHQVQHLLLRMIGPMLLMLAAPQGVLRAGLPDVVRRGVLRPILRNRPLGAVFAVIAQPVVATVLFIATLYFWQIPTYHDLALRDDGVHYLMHISLLFTGLVFFWRVFDSRPGPIGTRYGVRLMMLWIMVLSNIAIGATLAFKSGVIYTAYADFGRLWNFTGLADEELGAVILWVPSSMMGLIALLIVVHMWGRHETRVETRHAADIVRAQTPDERARGQAAKNRAMAMGFAAFVIAIFVAAIAAGVLSQMTIF